MSKGSSMSLRWLGIPLGSTCWLLLVYSGHQPGHRHCAQIVLNFLTASRLQRAYAVGALEPERVRRPIASALRFKGSFRQVRRRNLHDRKMRALREFLQCRAPSASDCASARNCRMAVHEPQVQFVAFTLCQARPYNPLLARRAFI